MKYFNTIVKLLFFIGLMLEHTLYATNLVGIVIVDEEEDPTFKLDAIRARRNLETIAQNSDLSLSLFSYNSRHFDKEKFASDFNNFSLSNDDCVFIYYAGHGKNYFGENSKFPGFRTITNGSYEVVSLEWLEMQFRARARLIVSVFDACNTLERKGATYSLGISDNYDALFRQARGTVRMCAAEKGTDAYSLSQEGGIFSFAFWKALNEIANKDNVPTPWNEVDTLTKKYTKELALKNKMIQTPYCEIKIQQI